MNSGTAFTALLLATTGWALSAMAAMAEPLPGLWERRFTAFMADPVSGVEKPWAEPADARCLSQAELRQLPFLTASSSKASYQADGASCTVSDEARTGQAASWILLCKESSGGFVEMRMSSEISDALIRVHNPHAHAGQGFGRARCPRRSPHGAPGQLRRRRCEKALTAGPAQRGRRRAPTYVGCGNKTPMPGHGA